MSWIYDHLKEDGKFSITLKHVIFRNEFLDFIAKNRLPPDYRRLANRIVTPYDSKVETYDEISGMLRKCVLSNYEGVDCERIRLTLNEFEYIFRPKFITREITVILSFEDKSQFNKMKLKHPEVFNNIKTYIVGDLDGNG